tara:strand:- start:4323 stop:4685 length:363 start_codon:yes stop_codon:yes gene_type:complete
MEQLISKFQEDDFPAREAQPYYYDENGKLIHKWTRAISKVDYGVYGEHRQQGFLIYFAGDQKPEFMVYNDAEGQIPEKGDVIIWELNDHYCEQLDYPTYTVRMEKRLSFIQKIKNIFRKS